MARTMKGRWENPATPLQAARLEKRWFGREAAEKVRTVCRGHGGRPCRLDQSKLSDYETGKRRPSVDHVEAFCKIYQKSPAELGLFDWGTDEDEPVQQCASNDPMVQAIATVLSDLEPSGYSGGEPANADLALGDRFTTMALTDQEQLASTSVSEQLIGRLESATDQHARDYYRLTHHSCLQVLVMDWIAARRQLRLPQMLSQRCRLADVYARLTGVLANLAFDDGHDLRARALILAAQDAAREAGDADLLGWLYARESTVSDWGDDSQTAIMLAERGLATVGRAKTRVAARLHGAAALGYAARGDDRAVSGHLEAACSILASPADGCWPDAPTMPRCVAYTEDALAVVSARSHLRLGNYTQAAGLCREAAVRQEQSGMAATTSLAVPLNQLNLAAALLHRGELDHACVVARAAVEQYRGVAIPRLMRQAGALAGDITAAHPDSSHSREFAEFLRSRTGRS